MILGCFGRTFPPSTAIFFRRRFGLFKKKDFRSSRGADLFCFRKLLNQTGFRFSDKLSAIVFNL